jgi:DnaK suppressor protein
MNATELMTLKSVLLEKKMQILNKSNEFRFEQAAGKEALLDEAESVARENQINVRIQLHEKSRLELFQIERALSKMEHGEYGCCESCGSDIGLKRLIARPLTSLCIVCQEDLEDPRMRLN